MVKALHIFAKLRSIKLSTIVVVAVCLLCVGIGATAYMTKRPLSNKEEVQSKPTPKPVTQKVATDKPTESSPSEPAPATAEPPKPAQPVAVATKPAAKRRGDSTNPEWVACQAKVNEMYIAHNAEIARLNQEKNAALAEADRMYYDGEMAYTPDGEYLEPYEQYNTWQLARQIISDEYTNELQTYSQTYQAQWDAQLAACDATVDH